MSSSAYYDPFPIVSLERPLVVAGMIHTESRQLAHRLASLHGLRFTDFDAALEHVAGQSLSQLREDTSDASVRRLERQVAEGLCRDEPYGVIALPERLLSMRSTKRLVEKRTTFVSLDYDLRDCYRRLTTAYRSDAPLWMLEADGPGKLGALYRQWTRRFSQSGVAVAMAGKTWRHASDELIGALDDVDWRPRERRIQLPPRK